MSMVVKVNLSRLDLEMLIDALETSIYHHKDSAAAFVRRKEVGWHASPHMVDEEAERVEICKRQEALKASLEMELKKT